jgi:hypothetical protein
VKINICLTSMWVKLVLQAGRHAGRSSNRGLLAKFTNPLRLGCIAAEGKRQ